MSLHLEKEQHASEAKQQQAGDDETFLPPRHVVHPAESEKVLRIFYLTLLWLFVLLVVGLLVWGWKRLEGGA